MIEHGKASSRWNQLTSRRSEVLTRADRAAEVTIPTLFPTEGHTEGSNLRTPYQSFGAKAVNNLSAKILLALFPPNTAFFKLGFDDVTRASLEGQVNTDQVDEDISLIEQVVVSELEQTRLRAVVSTLSKHLIVTGNGVIDVMPGLNFRFFSLRHYVVNRDPEGNVLELIIKEEVSPLTLSDEVVEACFSQPQRHEFSTNPDKNVSVYTVMQRSGKRYKVFQEINEHLVPGSDAGSYPLDAPRFVVLRWTSIVDEDYGRGMVDEYYGDIKALDDLSRDLLKASANAAKIIHLIDPNSHLTSKQLADANSGDILKGRAGDVSTVGVDKLHDFQIVLERRRDIQQDLSEAFLMNSSVQRNAERVTAEEIRFMAQELEDALGGVYSVLAQELQVPLLKRVLSQLGSSGLIPPLPKDGMKMSITTGLEALGRGHEVNKLLQFIQVAREAIGEQEMAMRLESQSILTQIAAGLGLNTKGLVRSEEDVQAAQQQAQQQALLQQAGPGVAQELVRQGGQPNG